MVGDARRGRADDASRDDGRGVDDAHRRRGRGRPRTTRTDAARAVARELARTRWSTPSSSLADAVEELVGVLRARRPAVDPGDGSGEPREVPDDHEAQAGERDRDGPERRRWTSPEREAALPTQHPGQPAAASTPIPTACDLPAPARRRAASSSRPMRRPDATTSADGRDRTARATAGARPSTSAEQPRRRRRRPEQTAATTHARSGPSAVATDVTPAAASRSRSARALAIASAAPARTAAGSRIAKTAGNAPGGSQPAEDGQQRDPDARTAATTRPCPWRTGRSRSRSPRMTTASATVGRPGRQREEQARTAAATATPILAADRATRPAGMGLPGLRPASRGRVDDVVQHPDRGLQARHRDAEADGRRPVATGQHGESRGREAVEDGRERVGQADEPADATADRRSGLRHQAGARRRRARRLRRRRSRRSWPRDRRSGGPGRRRPAARTRHQGVQGDGRDDEMARPVAADGRRRPAARSEHPFETSLVESGHLPEVVDDLDDAPPDHDVPHAAPRPRRRSGRRPARQDGPDIPSDRSTARWLPRSLLRPRSTPRSMPERTPRPPVPGPMARLSCRSRRPRGEGCDVGRCRPGGGCGRLRCRPRALRPVVELLGQPAPDASGHRHIGGVRDHRAEGHRDLVGEAPDRLSGRSSGCREGLPHPDPDVTAEAQPARAVDGDRARVAHPTAARSTRRPSLSGSRSRSPGWIRPSPAIATMPPSPITAPTRRVASSRSFLPGLYGMAVPVQCMTRFRPPTCMSSSFGPKKKSRGRNGRIAMSMNGSDQLRWLKQ